MTAVALDLLRRVSAAGGAMWLAGEMLRLSAPEPLPDDLRARLRQHKAEIVALLSGAAPAGDGTDQPGDVQVGHDLPAKVADDGVRAVLAAEGCARRATQPLAADSTGHPAPGRAAMPARGGQTWEPGERLPASSIARVSAHA
jgi:hypothetical protein